MPTKLIVPLLGEGVEEVSIVNWLVKVGAVVKEYDGLVEIETDKVVTEIPSPASGTILKILHPLVGETVPVGNILAWIGEPGESIPAGDSAPEVEIRTQVDSAIESSKEAATPKSSPKIGASGGRDPHLGFISPVVAKIASENGIDLSLVKGTGQNNRITKNDVVAYHKNQGKISSAPSQVTNHKTLVNLSPTRKRIAEHMVMSRRTSPHVTTVMEVDLSQVSAHRNANKADFAKNSTRLTFTAYFVAASVAALKAYPIVNSSWNEAGIIIHPDINIGMATDLGEAGLIVPVIKRAQDLSLQSIARAVNDQAERARANKLVPADVQGGTFTITNHGVTGSLFAMPIINQPQCAILGVGAIQKRVIVLTDEFDNDSLAIRPMVYVSLTFDHRILDGAIADHFLMTVVKSLENW